MSKWFNARFRALAVASVLAVFGCDQLTGANVESASDARRNPSAVVTRPDTDVDEVASAEPGRDRRQWRVASANARDFTGTVTTSMEGRSGPLMLAFANGITVTGESQGDMRGSASVGGGGESFAKQMNVDPSAKVYLYRVIDEQLSPSAARGGGLCGERRSTHVAVSEFVGASGNWVLRVASFGGGVSPGGAENPGLCRAFQYSAP
jgi:hypothetical protein